MQVLAQVRTAAESGMTTTLPDGTVVHEAEPDPPSEDEEDPAIEATGESLRPPPTVADIFGSFI